MTNSKINSYSKEQTLAIVHSTSVEMNCNVNPVPPKIGPLKTVACDEIHEEFYWPTAYEVSKV